MKNLSRLAASPGPIPGATAPAAPLADLPPPVPPATAALPLSPAAPRRPSQRERILDAADAVVHADGAAHLTLDAVAERAKVSKGGVLYHFKTKEALLRAMIDRHLHGVAERRAAAQASLPPGPGRELKAWALMSMANEKCSAQKRTGCSMLAAAANDPRLIEPFHRFQQWRLRTVQEAAAAGLPFPRAAVIMLALDGLGLLELHDLSPYDAAQRRAILEDLLRLIDETVTDSPPRPA